MNGERITMKLRRSFKCHVVVAKAGETHSVSHPSGIRSIDDSFRTSPPLLNEKLEQLELVS